MLDQQLAATYSPIIYFDEREPFFPVRVGVTFFEEPGRTSPSMTKRTILFDTAKVAYAIEYAIYFDFDIGHMYELEHFWVYVGHNGEVVSAEASFHGDYFLALFKDRRNLQGTHVEIYSQPGKHAFSPSIEFLELVPSLYSDPYEFAGNGGLMVPGILAGAYETNEAIDRKVTAYLQRHRFKPSMQFRPYELDSGLFCTWPELAREIPVRIRTLLQEME